MTEADLLEVDSSPLILPPLDLALLPNDFAIEAAYQYLCADTDDQQTQADLKKALAAIRRGYAITADGAVEIIGSDGSTIYVVQNGMCTVKGQFETSKHGRHRPALCRGWKAAQRRTGACYHCWTTDILRCAQAIERGDL